MTKCIVSFNRPTITRVIKAGWKVFPVSVEKEKGALMELKSIDDYIGMKEVEITPQNLSITSNSYSKISISFIII